MTTQDLLDYCDSHAVRLWVVNGKLCYDYPKGAITSRILNALKEHKAQIIERLSEPSASSAPPAESLFAVCSSPREIAANCKHNALPNAVAQEDTEPKNLQVDPPELTSQSCLQFAGSLKEEPANCKQESGTDVEPIAWEGDVPIFVYPGEKCIRCNRLPAVGTPECPRWCQVCYQRDQDFWKTFYAGKPVPERPPITYVRPPCPE